MNEDKQKIRFSLWLIYGSIVYIAAITFIIIFLSRYEINVTIAFLLLILPLLFIIAAVWKYKFKIKMPGFELIFFPVEKVMKKAVLIDGNKSIKEAEEIMEKNNVDFLSVIDRRGRLKGVFTKADAHRARRMRKVREKVEKMMTKDVVMVRKGNSIRDVIEKIAKTRHSNLPVVDENNKVIGIISSIDIHDLITKEMKNIKTF